MVGLSSYASKEQQAGFRRTRCDMRRSDDLCDEAGFLAKLERVLADLAETDKVGMNERTHAGAKFDLV